MTFKEFFKKPILGVREKIILTKYPELGEIQAKVDTGNEAYNVLHGIDIKEEKDVVSFISVKNMRIELPKKDNITIHIGSGVKEERPVVTVDFVLNNKEYKMMPFSIADRSENEDPVLLGEPFLKIINAIVDSNKNSVDS